MLAFPDVEGVLLGADDYLFVVMAQQNLAYFVLGLEHQLEVAFAEESHLVTVLYEDLNAVFLAEKEQASVDFHHLPYFLAFFHLYGLEEVGLFEMVDKLFGCKKSSIRG